MPYIIFRLFSCQSVTMGKTGVCVQVFRGTLVWLITYAMQHQNCVNCAVATHAEIAKSPIRQFTKYIRYP